MKKANILIIYFITLCSVNFYELKGITTSVSNTIQLLGIGTILGILLFHIIYYRGEIFKINMTYSIPLMIMTFFVVTSSFYAQYRFEQSIPISLYQSRFFFFFYLYYILHLYRPSIQQVEQALFLMGITAATIFLIQTIVYPVQVVESKMFIDRNTLRIFMRGEQFRILGYLIVVNRFFLRQNKADIIFMLMFLAVAVLVGSRSTLAFHILIPVMFIISQKRVKNRVMMLLLIVLALAIGAVIFSEIIESMIEVSQKNASEGDDYIRFQGINYFIYEFMTPISFITGNSIAYGTSKYGMFLGMLSMTKGYYLSDIGIVAILVNYGAIYVLVCFYIMIRTFFRKYPPELLYIRHYFLLLFMLLVFSYSVFGGGQGGVALSFIFYIIDKYKYDSKTQLATT